MTPADSAERMTTRMMHRAAMAPRLALSDSQISRRGVITVPWTAVGAEDSAILVMARVSRSASMPDARIQDAVDEIDRQVHEDHQCRHQQHATLHGRIVALENCTDDPAGNPGPGKDRLGQDGAAEQGA